MYFDLDFIPAQHVPASSLGHFSINWASFVLCLNHAPPQPKLAGILGIADRHLGGDVVGVGRADGIALGAAAHSLEQSQAVAPVCRSIAVGTRTVGLRGDDGADRGGRSRCRR